jgi:clan AA aspartic protease (TIGR02281 family)
MPRFFTVRWPILARLDGLLLFPVVLILASDIPAVRSFINRVVSPGLPPVLFRWGVSKEAAYWIEAVIAGLAPYILLLVVADRLLTVRKGFALLSAVATAGLSVVALRLAPALADIIPPRSALSILGTGRNAAYVICGIVVLLHLRPFWIGLADQGQIAMRIIDRTGTFGYRRDRDVRLRKERDVYYRQSSEFRGFGPQEELEGSGGVPKEGRGLKFLFGFAWIGIMAGLAIAYFHWGSWGSGGHETGGGGMVPGVDSGRSGGKAMMHPAALASISEPPVATPAPVAVEPPVRVAQLPMVQRPSDVAPGLNPGYGPGEAVALRGKDGGFAFDAMINGGQASVLFDTGASVVALRAEEAGRLGIDTSHLIYSAKVKTANGVADVAPVIIDKITIGNITQRHIVGYVAREGALPRNLLGQTFLAGLAGFNVENNRLVLKGP